MGRKMPKPLVLLSLLAYVLVISGCSSAGPAVKPGDCPTLPPLPANLMLPPETEKKVRDELFAPQPNVTPKLGGSKSFLSSNVSN
jgi:hypothetical protein